MDMMGGNRVREEVKEQISDLIKLSGWWYALLMEMIRERKDLEGKIVIFGQVKEQSLLDIYFISNY